MLGDTTRIAKNSILLVVRMAIVMIVSIFTTRYLIKNLGVEDYGVYAVTLGVMVLFSFMTPALSNASQRFHRYEFDKNGIDGAMKVFNSGLLIQIILVVFFIVIAETIGLWYVKEKLVVPDGKEGVVFWLYQILVASSSLSMLQVPFVSAILAHERMNFYAIISVFDAILKLVVAICIVFSPVDRLLFYGILLLGVSIIDFALYLCYSVFNFEEVRLKIDVDRSLLSNMVSFSGWNIVEALSRIGKEQACTLLLNYYCGVVVNAARNVSNQVSYALASVVDSTVMASKPQMVSNYVQGRVQASLSMFNALSKWTLFIVFAMSLPIFLEAETIIRLWLGDFAPEFAVIFIRVSVLVLLIDKLASPITALVHSIGNVRMYHFFSGIMNILAIPIAWLMLEAGGGPVSVYLIVLFGVMISHVLFLVVIKRLLPFSVRDYFGKVFYPFLLVAIFAAPIPILLSLTMQGALFRLVVVLILSEVLVAFAIYALGMTKAEKEVLWEVVKRIRG